jgi:ornithine cyclodeaminase/alanine dehydrogenase-like protein (mu-crystallin family)
LPPLFLSEEQVREQLDWPSLLTALEAALIEYSAGRAPCPVRQVVTVPAQQAFFGLMPAIYGGIMGAKLVTVFPQNADRGQPTHQGVIQLFRSDTGEPLATMDARLITEMRTAAVSALATRILAKADARVLAILGSGVQARAHLQALQLVRRFEQVYVWSRTPEHSQRFAQETGAQSVSAEEAVRQADVIVTVTHSPVPILQGHWLKPVVHVNAVGAVGPTRRELDEVTMQDATVVVESREAALQEAGDILLSKAPIHAELGELLPHTKSIATGKRTIYKSLGIGVEDLAVAKLVYERAAVRFA